jgi:hypothetical protein
MAVFPATTETARSEDVALDRAGRAASLRDGHRAVQGCGLRGAPLDGGGAWAGPIPRPPVGSACATRQGASGRPYPIQPLAPP